MVCANTSFLLKNNNLDATRKCTVEQSIRDDVGRHVGGGRAGGLVLETRTISRAWPFVAAATCEPTSRVSLDMSLLLSSFATRRLLPTASKAYVGFRLSYPHEHNAKAFSTQILTLNDLRDNDGARQNKRRVGRGIGSSKGKTCGRGHKGQGQRGTKAPRGFEGGQTPIWKRMPKRGHPQNRNAKPMNELNLFRLQQWIDQGRLDPTKTITLRDIHMSNVCGKVKHGVKLLGGRKDGKTELKTPVSIEVSRASKKAIAAVEAAGGTIKTVYFNRLGLRSHLMPHKFEHEPRRARPPPAIMSYYTSFENRGYLSPEVQLAEMFPAISSVAEAHEALHPNETRKQ